MKVIDEVKNSRQNASKAAPKDSSLTSNVKPVLGFLVEVEDCNALAWAEKFKKPYQDDDDESDKEGQDEEEFWRPCVDLNYPFSTIRSLCINYKADESKFYLFARVGKGKASEDQDKPRPEEPTEIGVFRVLGDVNDAREDVNKEPVSGWDGENGDYVAMTKPIPREGEVVLFDFAELVQRDKEKIAADQSNKFPPIKYAICFVKPSAKSTEGEGPARNKMAMCSKDDPKLIIIFDDKYEEEKKQQSDDDDSNDDSDGHFGYSETLSEDTDSDEEGVIGRFTSNDDTVVKVSENGVPLCENKHEMCYSDFHGGDYVFGWLCNICRRHGHGSRWVCVECVDDFCSKCACKCGPLLRYDNDYGGMKYSDCVAYAESKGTRLPTIAEVRQELGRNGGKPLFQKEDMWWPVSDAKDTWVSVGNYDPDIRLGNTHNEMFGVPPWSEEDGYVAERSVIAIVRSKKNDDEESKSGGDDDEESKSGGDDDDEESSGGDENEESTSSGDDEDKE
eukprot:CAMPEP_0170113840 /NCGR_PEP_ID=MMETSP0020_2-20130122/10240_1 /TAXON_ID=98059 /ORGANISM="Dinobryon sp., Strain UTEXLB2267" /LENGTH=504 /DNA_ID=CAMNT_0010340497 /DNA_START=1 /DNA_END=1516 /DNA_ORIENTATION=-